jgi:hypothetical protein
MCFPVRIIRDYIRKSLCVQFLATAKSNYVKPRKHFRIAGLERWRLYPLCYATSKAGATHLVMVLLARGLAPHWIGKVCSHHWYM